MTASPDPSGPLKILMITSDRFPPFRPAAKAIFGEEFARRGHIVDWLMQAETGTGLGGTRSFGNGRVYLAPTRAGETRLQRLAKHLLDFFNDFRVFSLTRKHRYDIIQVKDKYVGALLALAAAKLSGTPFCYWLAYPHAEADIYAAQNDMARYPLLYAVRGRLRALVLYKVLLRFADHVFVQSEQMRRDIEPHGIAAEKMTPVPGSLNLDTVDYRGQTDPGPEGPVVCYVGTLIRERRMDFLVRVHAAVVDAVPDARLLIVGKGENPEDDQLLADEIRRSNLPDSAIRFTGALPMDDVWAQIESAAVCVSPYYPTFELNSTSPTKLIEYMAMARPVVANEHPEQSLVIAESGAGVCVPWDESAFATAIIQLLKSPQTCTEMGAKGRVWVEEHRTNAIMADLVLEHFYRVLGRHPSDNSAGGAS